MAERIPGGPVERFFHYVNLDSPGGCWVWRGPHNGREYGAFRPDPAGKKVYGHVWSCSHWNGPIPDGYEVDHLCRNHWCVNPEHLEAVTHLVNVRRSFGWTEGPDGWRCQRGHHLGWIESGLCPQCQEMSRKRYRARIGGFEKRTPESRQRALKRERSLRRSAFLDEHPEIPADVVDSGGLSAARRRVRAGWTWSEGRWLDSDGRVRLD